MRDDYLPIERYGVIGDTRTALLVGDDAAIDWACFPTLDAESVFGALLDRHRGGTFRIAPVDDRRGSQQYVPYTNVLVTSFPGANGTLLVTDFLRLGEHALDIRPPSDGSELIRRVEARGETQRFRLELAPRFAYGTIAPTFRRDDDGVLVLGGDACFRFSGPLSETREVDGSLFLEGTVTPERPVDFRLRWGNAPTTPASDVDQALHHTIASWHRWLDKERTRHRDWAGDYQDLLIRSQLVLKLLTQSESGAIAAAATTSLPEEIGGVRNWDYRFAWIRDASLTVQALIAIGHPKEAHDFLYWLEQSTLNRHSNSRVPILYSLTERLPAVEKRLDHWEGYRQSRPVRIGNAAECQRQWDAFGEIVGATYELVRGGATISPAVRDFTAWAADRALERWREPDSGIWEIRGPARHYVHSKLLTWVGLERASVLARENVLQADPARWIAAAEEVRTCVLAQGYSPRRQSFVQSYESEALDASALLIPLHELLPFDDPRVQGTIEAIRKELCVDGLVYRYCHDDGLPGGEGAFVFCSLWLVEALALSGKADEAHALFASLAGRASKLGLFAEQIDPATGAFLGNFPQAFSHLGVINALLCLAYAEGKELPVFAPLGSVTHRKRALAA